MNHGTDLLDSVDLSAEMLLASFQKTAGSFAKLLFRSHVVFAALPEDHESLHKAYTLSIAEINNLSAIQRCQQSFKRQPDSHF